MNICEKHPNIAFTDEECPLCTLENAVLDSLQEAEDIITCMDINLNYWSDLACKGKSLDEADVLWRNMTDAFKCSVASVDNKVSDIMCSGDLQEMDAFIDFYEDHQ